MPRSTVLVFDRYAELMGAEMVGQIREVVKETATEIEQDVKGRAPKSYPGAPAEGAALAAPIRTGNLRRSYHTEEHFEGADMYAEVGNDPSVADYALFVEYGTVHMAPRPHLTPSSEAQRAPFLAKVAAILSGRRFR
jgi:hypothetical protein